MKLKKVLQVGVGSMGKRRIRNLQYLGYRDILCYDIRPDRREEAKRLYNVDAIDYSSINWDEFSHVIVSTPPDQHAPYAIDALKNKKHVFIEASVVDDGFTELLHLSEENPGVVLAPSCTMRFDPLVIKAKELIDSGKSGKVLFANHYFGQYLKYWHPYEDIKDFYVSKKATGGAREIVSFDLVYLTWLFGGVTKIAAAVKNTGALGVDIDDLYSIICETNRKIQFQVTIDVISRVSYRETRIVLEDGNIEINNVKGEISFFDAKTNTWQFFNRGKLNPSFSTEAMYITEMQHFLAATFGEAAFPYTLKEDHEILKTLYMAEESSEQKRIIDNHH